MATEWLAADAFTLRRLAWMLDVAHRGESTAALAGEARQIEDRFGLSPVSRRRLGWSVDEGVPAEVVPIAGRRSMRAVDEDEGLA